MIFRGIFERVGLFTIEVGDFSIKDIFYVICSVSFIPFIEEYVFRYLPFSVFRDKKYSIWVIVLSSLVFAILYVILYGYSFILYLL